MNFNTWIDTFIAEKGIDTEHRFEVEGNGGTNSIPVGVVVDFMKTEGTKVQHEIKTMIVKIDFMNGDVLHFFNHLAKAVAI